MGQYFKAVNTDKKEYVCPWCIGGGAKLCEWAANSQGAIFTLLLRKSDEGGGGDFYGYSRGCGEGGPINGPLSPIAGRCIVVKSLLSGTISLAFQKRKADPVTSTDRPRVMIERFRR